MLYFAAFVVALAMTMALIPPLIRFAGMLQLLDQPGERKVHVAAGSLVTHPAVGAA